MRWAYTAGLLGALGCAAPERASTSSALAPPVPGAATSAAAPAPPPADAPSGARATHDQKPAPDLDMLLQACSCHPFLMQLMQQRRAREAAGTAGATDPVGWAALDVQVPAIDPFSGLDPTQRRDAIAFVAWKLADRDRPADEAQRLEPAASAGATRLAAQGFQAEVLWIRARQLQLMHRTARLQVMTATFHGRTLRLTGYVVPLEQTAAGITEFLLVPSPPPAGRVLPHGPTQIIAATAATPFALAAPGAAVVVEGRITVGGELPVEIPIGGGGATATVRAGYVLDVRSVTTAAPAPPAPK